MNQQEQQENPFGIINKPPYSLGISMNSKDSLLGPNLQWNPDQINFPQCQIGGLD